MKYNGNNLSEVLAEHKKWIRDDGGSRANLRWARLNGADLRDIDLRWADLREAQLEGADLRWARLDWVYLWEARLYRADLQGAELRGAQLGEADLREARLMMSNLQEIRLDGANLSDTVLDPKNEPNGGWGDWEDAGEGYVFGYRTRYQRYQGGPPYEDGKTYRAPVFSTCPFTSCHPGLYVCSRPWDPWDGCPSEQIIRVKLRRADLHCGGGEHRTREFTVIGSINKIRGGS